MSSNHTHNWEVTYTATLPTGQTVNGVVWGRTRAVARQKVAQQHVDAPHGTRVRTTTPRKVVIV